MATHIRVFETLNAVRGLAAIAVVLFHMRGRLFSIDIAQNGYLAVDLFFVLSGFVIAAAYDQRLSSDLGFKRFAIIRAVRFWPLLALAIFIGALPAASGIISRNPSALPIGDLGIAIVAGLVLIPTALVGNGLLFPLNPPLWTLSCEMMVNLIYAWLFRFTNTVALGACAAGGAVLLSIVSIRTGNNDIGVDVRTYAGGIGRAIFGFSIGVIIFRKDWRINVIPSWAVCAAVAILLVFPISNAARIYYDLAFALILSPIIIMMGAAVEPTPRFSIAFAYLGTISFPLYAIHFPLVGIFARATEKLPLDPAIAAGVLIASLLILTPLLARFYDLPARRGLNAAIYANRNRLIRQ